MTWKVSIKHTEGNILRGDSRKYMRHRIRSGEKYKGLRNNHNTVWEGYTPKQGYVPDGVCHKNVAQGYGARVRVGDRMGLGMCAGRVT